MFKKKNKCRDCGFLASALRKVPCEFFKQGRDELAKGKKTWPLELICTRHVWRESDFKGKPIDTFCNFLISNRKCTYFFKYNPGYSPDEHKELQRESKTQRLLLIGMLSAAAIGAVAALIGQLIAN